MITVLVRFKVPAGTSRSQVAENMQKAAPRFQGVPGLIRKNFLYDEKNGIGGGAYTWETREAAEKFHADGTPWQQAIVNLYGNKPSVDIYETPVLVDNDQGRIRVAA